MRTFAAAITTLALLTSSTAAGAAPMKPSPRAGQCYQLAVSQWVTEEWITDHPVGCNTPHNFEVAKVGRIKDGPRTREALDRACSYELVLLKTGLPSWQAAIIDYPSRVVPYHYPIGNDGYVCGGSPEKRYPNHRFGLETVNRPFRHLVGDESSRLSTCLQDDGTGSAPAEPRVTTPCASPLHWLITRWVDLRAFYADYPGEAVLDERGREWCSGADSFSYPIAENWMKDGAYIVECRRRVPPKSV